MNDFWFLPESHTALAFSGIGLIYPIYHYFLQASSWRVRLARHYSGESLELFSVLAQRYAGGAWMALASIALALVLGLQPQAIGLSAGDALRTLGWVAMCSLLLPIIARGAAHPRNRAAYPQMRVTHWPGSRLRLNALAWAAYLFGYELFFRGLCLAWLTQSFGFWPGVLASSVLYAYAHLHKNAGETFGSLGMGVLFALMTLHTGAIWAAVIFHWLLATVGETSAIRNNPALTR